LVAPRVSRLAGDIVLNIDLDDSYPVVLAALKIAEDVLAVRFPTGDGEKVGGRETVGGGGVGGEYSGDP